MDIHPAGVLVGSDSEFAENDNKLQILMQRAHLKQDYRSLRLDVQDLSWQNSSDNDYLIFMRLRAGAYASGVLRQIFDC